MAALTERSVLVTGAFGNVGRYVLDRLPADERRVVATDVRTGANQMAADRWQAAAPAGQVREVAWVDLRAEDAVRRLVDGTDPHAVAGHATAETPQRPCEVYGAHKVEAERIVRERVADRTRFATSRRTSGGSGA